MYLKLTCVLMIYLLEIILSEIIDCIEGEIWFEPCRHCKCLNNGKYTCEPSTLSCRLGKCITDVVVFRNNFRCHCAKNNATICVPLLYQDEFHGKPCSEDYYYYDSCTYCKCDRETNTLQCISFDNCQLSSGGKNYQLNTIGVCVDDEVIFEDNCYKCNCTLTKFRKCVPSEECQSGKEKSGNCYIIQNHYSAVLQYFCMSIIKQECYSDYNCPGKKKCCHVVDCYLRCVDPYVD